MTDVFWTAAAQAELGRIEAFYAERNPDSAKRVGRAGLAANRILVDHPAAGVLIEEDVRKWSVRETAHLLLYRIAASSVQILRMYHARENWSRSEP